MVFKLKSDNDRKTKWDWKIIGSEQKKMVIWGLFLKIIKIKFSQKYILFLIPTNFRS